MIKRRMFAFPLLALALLAAMPASASIVLNLSLANPVQFFVPGGPIVHFVGTVSAPLTNTADVFLTGDSANVDFPLSLDDSPFFNKTTFTLSPGQSFTGDFFDVTTPGIAVPGVTYNGFFEVDGGANGNAGDPLASVTFTMTASPEPGTLILLLSGIPVLVLALRRKR
jgi:hypothetical protein